jgi:hypothetical protein
MINICNHELMEMFPEISFNFFPSSKCKTGFLSSVSEASETRDKGRFFEANFQK